MRVLLRLAYDGTDFRGWQFQPGLPTVQGTLEDAIEKLCRRKCPVHGAGRTDSGVHAAGMPAHADLSREELERVNEGLNGLLPRSMALLSVKEVRDDFHARFDAVSRTYTYSVGRKRDPFRRRFEYQPKLSSLDTRAMAKAAEHSLGTGSWKGFAKEGSGNASWIMSVSRAVVEESYSGWTFTITADRFLRGVVRIWSGTLLRIGSGAIPPETVSSIISGEDRSLAGQSLPACGLVLKDVEYASGE
ncbi:MAG TPA: tRNA pseudouridine(38-40) synthase TruA [Candidatus Sabulitectum sp.]|nr:tRNA pseudouridine(38-40) synthase TruA [Candidatus Sabulitectum sp.]HPF31835.1 tRNA pseudouridine(38-40) synthase TruA [Candidatus Sabulitectum sp.]HPJ28728.1 tRNA pseudouridine(38-40) synthase TruA [Candidatus Sabulitectum sp.]HPR23556.1 tRNA pseudouridine(38-40) synthase TruA [Candidatus Sabulitectum sp.]